MKINKKIYISLIIILLLILSACKEDRLVSDESEIVGNILGEDIKLSEIDDVIDRDYYSELLEDFNDENIRGWKNKEELDEYFDNIIDEKIDSFIRQKVIELDSKDKKISIDQKKLNKELEIMEKWYEDNMDNDENIKKEYKTLFKKDGKPTEKNLNNLKKSMLMDEHFEYFYKEYKFKENDIKSYFEKNKEKFIKLNVDIISSYNYEKINLIYENILNENIDLSSLVKEKDVEIINFGEDVSLDFYRSFIGDLVADELLILKPGEVSSIIKEQKHDIDKYFILMLNNKKDNLDELKEMVKKDMVIEDYDKYIQELLNSADIKINKDKIKNIEK